MIRRSEDVKPEALRLGHSALGGLAHLEGETVAVAASGVAPGRPIAQSQAPEPLRPVDPKGSRPLKPDSKVE